MKHLSFYLSFFLVAFAAGLFSQESIPHKWIENLGQWPKEVQAKAEIPEGAVFLERDGLTYHLLDLSGVAAFHGTKKIPQPDDVRISGHAFKMQWQNAQSGELSITKSGASDQYFNYYLGNDPDSWASGARAYQVIEQTLYDGIRWKTYASESFLKHDLILEPGADPEQITWNYSGDVSFALDNGRMKITTSLGAVYEQKPIAFQWIDGEKVRVKCDYNIVNGVCSYSFPKGYDDKYPLVVDPELIFSTYSGSTANNFGYTATYDEEGHLYAGGSAFGTGYPISLGAYQTTHMGGDGIGDGIDMGITKYALDGTSIVYSTYVGGEGDDLPHSLVCNADNELYIFGTTASTDYPTTAGTFQDAFQGGTTTGIGGVGATFVGGSDMVLSRLSQDGTDLLSSTYYGGSENDGISASPDLAFNYADQFRGEIDVDEQGQVYIASSTFSIDLPLENALQSNNLGDQDGVVALFDANLENLLFATYLGGTNDDALYSIAIDASGDMIVAGGSNSPDLPSTAGAYQETFQGGSADAFLCRIDGSTFGVSALTYVGSDVYDQYYFTDLDGDGNVYFYGQSLAPNDTWIINAAYSNANSGMWIGEMDPGLTNMEWSTVFGSGDGEPNLSPTAFLVDVCNNIYLSGWGGSTNTTGDTNDMDVTPDAYQSTTDGSDFYLLVISNDGGELVYGSYFGGNVSAEHVDGGTSRFSRKGEIYQSVCAGCGGNDDFPIFPSDAVSPINASGSCNNGVFKLAFELNVAIADFSFNDVCLGNPTQFTSTGLNGVGFEWDFGGLGSSTDPNPTFVFPSAGTFEVTLTVVNPETCNGQDEITKTVSVQLPISNTAETLQICQGEIVEMGVSSDPNVNYLWLPSNLVDNPLSATTTASPLADQNYTLLIDNGACTDTLFQSVLVDELAYDLVPGVIVCGPEEITLLVENLTSGTAIVWDDDSDFSSPLNDDNSDPDIMVQVSGNETYYLSLTNGQCEAIDTVQVELIGGDISATPDFVLCNPETVILSVDDPSSLATYSWSPSTYVIGTTDGPSISVSPDDDIMYTVTATYTPDCEQSTTVDVDVSELWMENLITTADPDALLDGGEVNLAVLPEGYNYNWTPSIFIDNPSLSATTANISSSTWFEVTVSDGFCFRTDSVFVGVTDFICGRPTIYVPNAVTPNGDGNNDQVFVRGENLTDILLVIYNRWGEKVFETSDQSTGWNCTHNGKDVDPAVYVYTLQARCLGGAVYEEEGNITVIR